MTPLRQRFVDDLRLRNYAQRTVQTYVGRVVAFAKHFGRSPEVLGREEVRAFQLHLLSRRVSWSTFNQTVCALRFLYGTTLGQPERIEQIPYGKRPKKLRGVLAPEEVLRLLNAASPGRDRLLLQIAYACGLRLNELLHVQVRDIDSARMAIYVRHGKGAKERQVPLSARLLAELRDYWRCYRPTTWLFPSRKLDRPLSHGSVQRLFRRVARKAALGKRCSMHTLRHSYATHLLEAGAGILVVQELLGHRNLQTTAGYLHVSTRALQATPSLLDLLVLPKDVRPATTQSPRSRPSPEERR